MFKDNLAQIRRLKGLTQEELAEAVGVSRQTVAKWESGETQPDLERGRLLADALEVTLDDLANYDPAQNLGFTVPPRGKYIFGAVTVDEQGRIPLPEKARAVFGIRPGDRLLALGDESQGIAIVKPDGFLAMTEALRVPEEE